MYGSVYRSAVIILTAEVLLLRTFLILRDVDGMVDKLGYSVVFCCRDRYHRHPQHVFHPVYIDSPAVSGHLIHHVQGNYHGDPHLQELYRKIHVPLYVCSVHYVDDGGRPVLQNEISGYDLLTGIRRHGIDARKVCYEGIGMAFDHAVLPVYRNSGEISHVLVRSRKLVEKRGLTAVLVSHERIGEYRIVGKRMLCRLIVILSRLSKAGMIAYPDVLYPGMFIGSGIDLFNVYLGRIVESQSQLISMYL